MTIIDNRAHLDGLGQLPFAATCLLQIRFDPSLDVLGYGTGFHIGGGRIATAGHNLWSDAGGRLIAPQRPYQMQVFLGNGFYAGYAELNWSIELSSTNIVPHPEFVSSGEIDVGYVQLPNVPSAHMPLMAFPGGLSANDSLRSCGFPTDLKPFGMYDGSGSLSQPVQPQFRHCIATAPGQSGSPIRTPAGNHIAAIGIDLGVGTDGGDNRGLALTPQIISWLHG